MANEAGSPQKPAPKPAPKPAAKKATAKPEPTKTQAKAVASGSGRGNKQINVAGNYWTVNGQYASVFTAFLKDLDRITGGYITSRGGFNNRDIAGTNTKSLHAFGLAIDVGPGTGGRNDRTLLKYASAAELRGLAAKYGLTWGGTWNNPDYMHFQVAGYQTKGQTLYFNGKVTNSIKAPSGGGGGGGMASNKNVDWKQLAAEFGYSAAFFLSDPSLKRLIDRASDGDWTEEMFVAKLQATSWYKKHTAAERQWIALETGDKREARQQVNERREAITQLSKQLGVALDPQQVGKIADTSLRFGWDNDRIRDAIAAEFEFDAKGHAGGLAGEATDDLRELSRQYLVPLADKTLARWTEGIIAGDATAEDFTAHMRAHAKSLFPELSEEIDKGITVDDYLSPYREIAAQTLEINPEDINWFDPKWSGAAFGVDESGKRKITSLADWGTALRTESKYGYDKTAGAIGAAADLAMEFRQMFTGAA